MFSRFLNNCFTHVTCREQFFSQNENDLCMKFYWKRDGSQYSNVRFCFQFSLFYNFFYRLKNFTTARNGVGTTQFTALRPLADRNGGAPTQFTTLYSSTDRNVGAQTQLNALRLSSDRGVAAARTDAPPRARLFSSDTPVADMVSRNVSLKREKYRVEREAIIYMTAASRTKNRTRRLTKCTLTANIVDRGKRLCASPSLLYDTWVSPTKYHRYRSRYFGIAHTCTDIWIWSIKYHRYRYIGSVSVSISV
jgi:hypothetical protein